MLFHRQLEATENSDRTFGGWLWRLPSNEWSKFVVKTFSTIDSISTTDKGTKFANRRRDLSKSKTKPTFYSTFPIATQFKPKAGICSSWRSFFSAFSSWYFSSHKLEHYSTARTGDLFSAFSLWYFSSHKLEYYSTARTGDLFSAFSLWYFSSHKREYYSTARAGDLFSAFSLWYFSSHKLEYYSTARTGDLFRLSLLVILFKPQAGIL